MATPLAEAFVRFRADASLLKPDVDREIAKVDTATAGTKAGKRYGTGLGSGLKSTIGAFSGVLLAAGVTKFGRDSVAAYKDAQTQQAKLGDAFKRFPALSDTNQKSLQKLNTQLEAKTKFDDDATASGQAVLAQFKLTGTQVTQLTPLLQDYAAKTGKDLPTAAGDLGKALLGQGRALKGVGINFKDTGTTGGNFAELMGGLRTQVGGFAANEGKTAAGQTAILKNQFGELQETVGSKLVPGLTGLVGMLSTVVVFVTNNLNVIGPLVGVIGGLALGVWAVNAAAKAYAATQAALNVILTANPIGLIVIAIAALVIGLVIAYKKSETFRNIVNAAFHAVGAAVAAVVGFIRDHWVLLFAILTGPVGLAVKWVVQHWGGIVGFFAGIPGKIKGVVGGVVTVLTAPFRTAFNAIADLWNGTVGTLSFHIPDWVPKLGGKGFSMPKLPHLALGTSDFAGGFARVGERGPETVWMPQHSQVWSHGDTPGGAGVTIPVGKIELLRGGPEDVANDLIFAMRARGH